RCPRRLRGPGPRAPAPGPGRRYLRGRGGDSTAPQPDGRGRRDRRLFELHRRAVTPATLANGRRLRPGVRGPRDPPVRDRPEERRAAPGRAGGSSVLCSPKGGRRSLGLPGPVMVSGSMAFFAPAVGAPVSVFSFLEVST